MQIRLKLLEDVEMVPVIKTCATVNGRLKMVGGSVDAFEGNDFPLQTNHELNNSIDITIPISEKDWPALVKVYISDNDGNFCDTYEQFYLNEL